MTGESKRQRLNEIVKRLCAQAPFRDGATARMALEEIMRQVEDEFSGIPENKDPVNSSADGRMYPPDDAFEILTGSRLVRTFKQTRHQTLIGTNGGIKIIQADKSVEVDLAGADGRSIADLLSEEHHYEHD